MPTWTQKVHDSFTDSDGTALASHTPNQGSGYTDAVSGCVTSAGRLSGNNVSYQYSLNNTVLAAVQACEFTIFDRGGEPKLILLGGVSGGNMTGYVIHGNAFDVTITKFTGSGATESSSLAAAGAGIANSDVLRGESDGAGTITALVNGTPVCSASGQTDYTSGKVGVGCFIGLCADEFFAYEDASTAFTFQQLTSGLYVPRQPTGIVAY